MTAISAEPMLRGSLSGIKYAAGPAIALETAVSNATTGSPLASAYCSGLPHGEAACGRKRAEAAWYSLWTSFAGTAGKNWMLWLLSRQSQYSKVSLNRALLKTLLMCLKSNRRIVQK